MATELDPASPIPIVDFSKWHTSSSSPSARQQIAHELISAFRKVGFVYLLNHGLSQSLLEEAFTTSKALFSLSHEEKMLAPHPPGPDHHRGYSPPGMEKVTQLTFPSSSPAPSSSKEQGEGPHATVPDCKESYEIGSEANPHQPKIWLPDAVLPGFRTFTTDFYWQCHALAREILRAIALGLGKDDDLDFFVRCHTGLNNQLRFLHYPPLPAALLEEGKAERIAAHSDWSSITMLFQDDCGGLEVEDPRRAKTFVPATPVRGACVVNVGDLMMRWSNGRGLPDYLKSTLHRVALPPLLDRYEGAQRMTRARYSIPYFVAADPETLVECLPVCTDAQHPAKYEAVTQEAYGRLRAKGQY